MKHIQNKDQQGSSTLWAPPRRGRDRANLGEGDLRRRGGDGERRRLGGLCGILRA